MKSLQSSSYFLQQRLGFKTGCIARTILGIDADDYEDLYYDSYHTITAQSSTFCFLPMLKLTQKKQKE
ncbi:MAG: hypothetical protein ACQESZ_08595, partial [Bacteroidota bacterium]